MTVILPFWKSYNELILEASSSTGSQVQTFDCLHSHNKPDAHPFSTQVRRPSRGLRPGDWRVRPLNPGLRWRERAVRRRGPDAGGLLLSNDTCISLTQAYPNPSRSHFVRFNYCRRSCETTIPTLNAHTTRRVCAASAQSSYVEMGSEGLLELAWNGAAYVVTANVSTCNHHAVDYDAGEDAVLALSRESVCVCVRGDLGWG